MHKKYSYTFLVALVIFSLSYNVFKVGAAEAFMISQYIYTEDIESESCIQLIRQQASLSDTQSLESIEIVSQLELISQELEIVNSNYEALNQQINDWYYGDEHSLAYANEQLDYVIELIYAEYQHDEAFLALSVDEQTVIIQEHEVVIEWLDYIVQIESLINQAIVERTDIETYYNQLNYNYELYVNQLDQDKVNESQLNQCLLFPYSVSKLASEDSWFNSQSQSLDEVLLQVDQIMQTIVPIAYRKVAFSDIFRIYNQLYQQTHSENNDESKMSIYLDENGLKEYRFKRELSLKEIEVVAGQAFEHYLVSGDFNAYLSNYQTLLNIKEEQLRYWYQINEEAIEQLKTNLANYLNEHAWINEEAIDKIKTLHQRYQIKLILFNDNTQSWSPAPYLESGYLYEYSEMDLNEPYLPFSQQSPQYQTLNTNKSIISNSPESIESSSSHLTNNLDDIQSRINRSNQESFSQKSLPKPGDISSYSRSENADETPSSLKNQPITLPSTGEKQGLTYLAIGLLLVGMLLLLINIIIKRKQKEKLDDIKLD